MRTETLNELVEAMSKKKLYCEVNFKAESGNFTFAEATIKFKEEQDLKRFIDIIKK